MTEARPPVAIVRDAQALPDELLARAASAIGLGGSLQAAFAREGHNGQVVIVPAMDGLFAGSPAMADPALVETLVDLFHALGAPSVILGGTEGDDSLWLENRDVGIRADLLGYRYVTPEGRDYDIVDLAEDAETSPFPGDSVLAGIPLSTLWQEAAFRVVVSACRTDRADGFALSLDTLLSVLPGRDKTSLYRRERNPAEVLQALLAVAPVDAVFIDAMVSSHGEAGAARPVALATASVIAATDPWRADAVGALLMGMDPAVSRLWGAREGSDAAPVAGSLAPFAGWVNAPPRARQAAARRAKDRSTDLTITPLLPQVDTALFPFRNEVSAKAHAAAFPILSDPSTGPAAAALFDQLAAQIAEGRAAWRIMQAKDAMTRIAAPIDIDPATIEEAQWAAVGDKIARQRALLRGLCADAEGLRWRMVGGAVLFDCVRRFPVPFTCFADAVQVHCTIQFMNDYIGGEARTIASDKLGRVTRQLERNLYLPQPNFTALLGGQVIDVTKIETITYEPDRHIMAWQTLSSANGSALADDGLVEFASVGGDTIVTIFARQHFRQPPLVEALNLPLWPELHDALVTDAYRRFARRTFANLEAVLEGREVRIGCAAARFDAPDLLPADVLVALAERLRDRMPEDWPETARDWFKAKARGQPVPVRVDADGLRHFAPGSARSSGQAEVPPRVPGQLNRELRVVP